MIRRDNGRRNVNHFRSQYSLSRYFTPPRIEPLNLDLAQLGGGGVAPAQFYGETHDGREVYVRYRGGGFEVWMASKPGADAYAAEDSSCILEGEIGPPFHGGMTVGQACHLFGITINGTRPPLPTREEMYRKSCVDLSGATTFYDVWLSSTLETQKRFLTAALAALPKATLILPVFGQAKIEGYRICPTVEELTSSFPYIFVGAPMTADALAHLSAERVGLYDLDDHIVIRLMTSGFEHPIRKYDNSSAVGWQRATGKALFVAGQVDECVYGSLSLHSQFRTGDSEPLALFQELDRLLDEFYPAYEVAWFDLLTGDKVIESAHVRHFDPHVVNWLNAGPDRWLYVHNKSDDAQSPRWIGGRTIRMVR